MSHRDLDRWEDQGESQLPATKSTSSTSTFTIVAPDPGNRNLQSSFNNLGLLFTDAAHLVQDVDSHSYLAIFSSGDSSPGSIYQRP